MKQPHRHQDNLCLTHKITLCTWTFIAIVLYSSFSGCLLSFMTLSITYKIETLTALANAVETGNIELLTIKSRPYTDLFEVK